MLMPRGLSVEKFSLVLPRMKDGVLTHETYLGKRRFNQEYCRIDFFHSPLNLRMSDEEFERISPDLQDLTTPFAGYGVISIMLGYEKAMIPKKYHDWLYMYDLYVDPDHRRIGLGSAINQERKKFAERIGKPILLRPDPDTPIGFCNLIQFNEKNGFHQLEGGEGFWGYDGKMEVGK